MGKQQQRLVWKVTSIGGKPVDIEQPVVRGTRKSEKSKGTVQPSRRVGPGAVRKARQSRQAQLERDLRVQRSADASGGLAPGRDVDAYGRVGLIVDDGTGRARRVGADAATVEPVRRRVSFADASARSETRRRVNDGATSRGVSRLN